MIAERILPRQERHQNAGEAVARREIGVGAALHGRDLDHAGEARRCCRRGSRRSGSACRRRGPTILAARMLPPATRAAKPNAV